LRNLDDDTDFKRTWGRIRQNIKAPATENLHHYDLKENKTLFYEVCSKFLNQRKQAKLRSLQHPRKNMEIIRKI
jgi:hypothetical protein